jgi:hypothetical protein
LLCSFVPVFDALTLFFVHLLSEHLKERTTSLYCSVSFSGVLDWRAVVQPTPLSDWYKIKIVYHQDRTTLPRVWVIDPALQRRDGKLPPHLYREGNLCLFLPRANEWDSSKPIALTILSWTSLWLYFYELWLATGQWYGGGEHPPQKVETETESRVDELAKRRLSGGRQNDNSRHV